MRSRRSAGTSTMKLLVATVLIGAFGFGWNTGVMNNAKASIQTCTDDSPSALQELTGLASCLPMSDAVWGVVVAAFCAGGLVGGVSGAQIADNVGRRNAARLVAVVYVVAGVMFFFAGSVPLLVIGRLVVGFACGASTAIVPLYLGETAPPSVRGAIGTLNQVVINVGILISQILGIYLAKPFTWRMLLALTAVPAAIQSLLLLLLPESPKYLVMLGDVTRARATLAQLRDPSEVEVELEDLLREADSASGNNEERVSIRQLIFNLPGDLRLPLLIGCMLQIGQQFSGINIVFYYSTSIFSSVFHSDRIAMLLSLMLSVVSVLTVFVAAAVIDRIGRKPLLFASSMGMAIASGCIVMSFLFHTDFITAILLVFFVIAFALGLGPIPWLILAELFPIRAAGAAASIAVAVNWASNFTVGVIYLPLTQLLGDISFLPFAIFLGFFSSFVLRVVPETKGRSTDGSAENSLP